MRTFLIYYPECNRFDTQEVNVLPGEFPESAIQREGDPWEAWVLRGEVFPVVR